MVLDVSDTIVLCFILLLASLAPATINPTMVRQELQVTVARVTVVRSDRHHYSSSPASPSAAARSRCGEGGRQAGCGRLAQSGGKLSQRAWLSSWCGRTCDLHNLLTVVLFLPLPREKKKNNPKHQIGTTKKDKRAVYIRC